MNMGFVGCRTEDGESVPIDTTTKLWEAYWAVHEAFKAAQQEHSPEYGDVDSPEHPVLAAAHTAWRKMAEYYEQETGIAPHTIHPVGLRMG